MIFYKPETEIENITNLFNNTAFDNNSLYGAYIGINEDGNAVGKCLMKINGYNCEIVSVDCDYTDKLLVEGFLRAALNFCANRSAYMAHCSITEIKDVLLYLRFKNENGVYSGDIPTLLKGSCCK